MRLLVCGSRGYTNHRFMERVVKRLKPDRIIHGGQRGADVMAGEIAAELDIPCDVYMADWDRYGKSAGYRRNRKMLDEGKPDLVVGFFAGVKTPGTAMMVRIAALELVPVKVYGLK